MIVDYVWVAILHLIAGVWMIVGLDLFIKSYNPIWKPIVVLFWPFGVVMLLWKMLRDWVKEVKEYYKED